MPLGNQAMSYSAEPSTPGALAQQPEAATVRSPRTAAREWSPLVATRESRTPTRHYQSSQNKKTDTQIKSFLKRIFVLIFILVTAVPEKLSKAK